MTEWASLRDGYGNAADIPALINAWVETPSEERLSDLWGRLCHQGTVYPASFKAVPLLYQSCSSLPPIHRRNALMLIGAILASTDRHGGAAPDDATLRLIPTFQQLIEAGLGDVDVDESEFPYLLQAAAAFRGEPIWGRVFDHLATEEFDGVCPECGSRFFIATGRDGYFVAAEDYARHAGAKRIQIAPRLPDAMPPIGVWLYEHATRHKKAETARGVAHLFGETTCPVCNAAISLAAAIERAYSPRPHE